MRVELLLLCALLTSCQGDTIQLGAGRATVPRFDTPRVIEGVSFAGATDDDPALNAALTVLYFNSERAGGQGREDIWFTSRASTAEPWATPRVARELNSPQRETGIALSADGLTILFSSDRDGQGLDVYRARRAGLDLPFSAPSRVAALSGPGDDLVSGLADAEVFLARRDDAEHDYRLFVASRARDDEFGAPRALSALDHGGPVSDAFAVNDRQLLYTRDQELWLAERDAGDAVPRPFAPLTDLNSAADDRDVWATPDLRYVVFSSNRDGSYQLYEATRSD